jgi:mRNA interferase RelE/StbE
LWRYRIGDWRVVVDIYDDRLVILALDIEHRSRVYR